MPGNLEDLRNNCNPKPLSTGNHPTGEHFEVLQRFTGSGFTVQGYHFFVSLTRRLILRLRFILQSQERRVFVSWLMPRPKWSVTIGPCGPVSR